MIVAVMAMVATAAVAQTTFGVKAGVNFASMSGDDFDGLDGRTSMAFGGFAKFQLSEKFAFQPELLLSMQGAKGSVEEEGIDVDVTAKLNYLNIPLMAKYYISEGFSLQAGPQIGFNVLAEAKMEAMGQEAEEDIEDIKGVDFGFNLGAGYELENGLGFEARYNLGLSNVGDWDDADGKNRVFSIAVSYAF